jgi:putative transposase
MARRLRLMAGGETHHVIQRGNNRQAIFFEAIDRQLYLEWLTDAVVAQGALLHAYVLMTNHVHLLVTAPRAISLPRIMQSLGRRYVAHINRAHDRTGTLWEGRYRSTILDSEAYLLACYRYIEANPLRAGMVARACEHPWSSHCHNALGESDHRLTEHPVYLALGPTPEARQQAYRALFDEILEEDMLATLRDATQRGWVPGGAPSQSRIAAATGGRAVAPPRLGRPPKSDGDVPSQGGFLIGLN